MTNRFGLAVATALFASGAAYAADMVAPTDVVFGEYGEIEASLSGTPGNVENGAVLMNKGAGNCIACHAVSALSDLPFHGEVGPSRDGTADRWTEADLRGIVANAKNVFPGTIMPSFYKVEGFTRLGNAYTGKAHEGDVAPLLTAQEIEDVVAFLMTLKEQ